MDQRLTFASGVEIQTSLIQPNSVWIGHCVILFCTFVITRGMCQGGKPDTGKFHSSYIVCGSAYENGCVVDGTCAMAAY